MAFQQAATWPPPSLATGGSWRLHLGFAKEQRGAKRQPGGDRAGQEARRG